MTLLGKNSLPQELDLSPTVLTLVFFPAVGMLLTLGLGMIEATFEHDSIVVTQGMALLGKNGVPPRT